MSIGCHRETYEIGMMEDDESSQPDEISGDLLSRTGKQLAIRDTKDGRTNFAFDECSESSEFSDGCHSKRNTDRSRILECVTGNCGFGG